MAAALAASLAAAPCAAAPGAGGAVTVTDSRGHAVEISRPVRRIICLNSGLSALVAALGASDRLVGRDSFSTFPSSLERVPVVGKSSGHPNMELIVGARPDLVLADTMLNEEQRAGFTALGIPVVMEVTSDTERFFTVLENLGLVLDAEEQAERIAAHLRGLIGLVEERVERLRSTGTDMPKVFFEAFREYKSASARSGNHRPIVTAGGRNIAAAEPARSPVLSPEYILQKNPDVIVRRISGDAGRRQMRDLREEIMGRPGLGATSAVRTGRVHVIKADILLSLRYPIGLLTYARWFHPEAFADIDPREEHRRLVETFFGEEEWSRVDEIFAFPR